MSYIDLKHLLDNGHRDIIDLMIQKQIIGHDELANLDESNRKIVVGIYIKQNILKNPTLKSIVDGKYYDIIKLLLQHQLIKDLEEIFEYQRTLLLIAVEDKKYDIVTMLIEQGANIHALSQTKYSAVFLAVYQKDVPLLKFLLDKGADPNLQGQNKSSPLIRATSLRHLEMVQLLVDHGADLDAQDSYGNSALIIAAWSGIYAISKLLIDAGAKLSFKDSHGKTALDYAKEKNCSEIVDAIEAAMDKCDTNDIIFIYKDSYGEIYPVLIPKELICIAVYRVKSTENVPTTKLVAITDDETTAQVWANDTWSDKKISTKGMSIQLSKDAVHKIDYHVVMIDGVKSYAKFGVGLKITSGVTGDCYRG